MTKDWYETGRNGGSAPDPRDGPNYSYEDGRAQRELEKRIAEEQKRYEEQNKKSY